MPAANQRGSSSGVVIGGVVVASLIALVAGAGMLASTGGGAKSGAFGSGGDAVLASGSDHGLRAESDEADAPSTSVAATTPSTATRPAAPTPRPLSPITTAASGSLPTVTLPPVTVPTTTPGGVIGIVPGTVNLPFVAGQSVWTATVNGVDLRMKASSATPKAGEAVTLELSAKHESLPCCPLYLMFGDGGQYASTTSGPPSQCLGQPYSMSGNTRTTTHTFNKAGRWQIMFSAYPIGCTYAQQAANQAPTSVPAAALTAWIEIGAGMSTGQGPELPTVVGVGATHFSVPAMGYLALFADLRDADGYIGRATVDWGDGSAVQNVDLSGFQPCVEFSGGWPRSHVLMGLMPLSPVTHQYAKPDTYDVTVTAISTGCDGSVEQRASSTLHWG